MGFIPEDPNDPRYPGTVDALSRLAHTCADHGIELWFETGQETPTTLLRTFDDIGTDNLGINLDPANLLLYGKANPLDAVDQSARSSRASTPRTAIIPQRAGRSATSSPWAKAGSTSRC